MFAGKILLALVFVVGVCYAAPVDSDLDALVTSVFGRHQPVMSAGETLETLKKIQAATTEEKVKKEVDNILNVITISKERCTQENMERLVMLFLGTPLNQQNLSRMIKDKTDEWQKFCDDLKKRGSA